MTLHQRNCFNISENAIRVFNNFSLSKLNISINLNIIESIIVVYSLIENFMNFSIDHS